MTQFKEFTSSLTPMRWALVALFMTLVFFEFFNGVFDIGNIIAPILLLLLLNQYYLQYKKGQGTDGRQACLEFLENEKSRVKKVFAFARFILKSLKSEVFAESPKLTPYQRATKILMNNLFVLMFIIAFTGGLFGGLNGDFKLFAILVWSLAFLGLNVREFIRTLSYARLFMANIGLIFVLGSFTLIIL